MPRPRECHCCCGTTQVPSGQHGELPVARRTAAGRGSSSISARWLSVIEVACRVDTRLPGASEGDFEHRRARTGLHHGAFGTKSPVPRNLRDGGSACGGLLGTSSSAVIESAWTPIVSSCSTRCTSAVCTASSSCCRSSPPPPAAAWRTRRRQRRRVHGKRVDHDRRQRDTSDHQPHRHGRNSVDSL